MVVEIPELKQKIEDLKVELVIAKRHKRIENIYFALDPDRNVRNNAFKTFLECCFNEIDDLKIIRFC